MWAKPVIALSGGELLPQILVKMISRLIPHPVRRFFGVKISARPPEYTLIDHTDQLAPLLENLGKVDEVFMDTEADNMYHYRTRLCLMQLMADRKIFLVDVLSPTLNLEPLWPLLRNVHLVMHGSDFDLRLLKSQCDFRAKSMFDTMLAAQLLNRKRIGLAGLLEEHFGVELDKDGQKANWSKRPLVTKLLDYASLDVYHLPELRDILQKELKKLGRSEWMEQQCRAQIDAGAEGFAPPDENDWRIGPCERLHGAGLSVLHALWHWREEMAQRIDTPPFKVCNNDLLLKLSFAAEEGHNADELIAGVQLGKRHGRLIGSLSAAIREGIAHDPKTLPRRKHQRHAPLSPEEVARQDSLKAFRDQAAKELNLDPTLIANRAQLAQLAREPDKSSEILLPWQASLLMPKLQG
jgi:ribonuclease D